MTLRSLSISWLAAKSLMLDRLRVEPLPHRLDTLQLRFLGSCKGRENGRPRDSGADFVAPQGDDGTLVADLVEQASVGRRSFNRRP